MLVILGPGGIEASPPALFWAVNGLAWLLALVAGLFGALMLAAAVLARLHAALPAQPWTNHTIQLTPHTVTIDGRQVPLDTITGVPPPAALTRDHAALVIETTGGDVPVGGWLKREQAELLQAMIHRQAAARRAALAAEGHDLDQNPIPAALRRLLREP